LINDILDFSKIEAGKLDIESSAFELDDVMSNLSTLMAQKVHDKGIELIFDISPDIPPALRGDPLRLGQVLTNLVGNAVKFTEEGEIRVVGEKLEQVGGKVKLRFSIEDSGIGMTREQADRLFQPFSQADSSTSRKYGGTGLGLAISKRLVELMDGSIRAESLPGKGSVFTFTAWFGVSDTIRRRIVPERLNHLKVLVVDDNASAREILLGLLTKIGGETEQAASGAEAIEAVRRADAERPFDLVLLDWRMPGLDGIETARRIKGDGALRAQPAIVIVTAFGQEGPPSEAEAAGIQGWLVKPISSSTLVNKLVELFAPDHEGDALQEPERPRYDLTGLRILLAEDNKINRQIAVELLEGVGASVETAKNGREVVDTLLAEGGDKRFDLVLMDLQMPEMDGYQATARIKATPRLATLPIIAMTAHALAEERDRCLAAGMRGHVSKPIDPDLLFGTLAGYRRPDRVAAVSASAGRAAQPRDARVPDIAGFDVAGALRRVAGDVKLYRSLLRQFAEQQAGTDSAIREALNRQDKVTAARLAHTIKGVAGSLGATSLQEIAAELERAVGGYDKARIGACLPRFAVALAATIDAIGRHLMAEAHSAPAADPVTIAPLLARLRRHLVDSDGQSLSTFLETRDRVAGPISEAELDDLQNLVGDFDFAAALERLDGIAQRLGLALE
jgi:two-component system sensor histidine kinase/response regulator